MEHKYLHSLHWVRDIGLSILFLSIMILSAVLISTATTVKHQIWIAIITILLVAAVGGMVYALHKLYIKQKENKCLREELQEINLQHNETRSPTATIPTPDGHDGQNAEMDETVLQAIQSAKLTEKDYALYERLVHEILTQRLYLRPQFSKKMLLKEIHVPTNKFATLFQEFAGCSFTQYIQDLRLEHAVRLMCERPMWSFESIAKEAQMSESTFYKLFQTKYGMKPSDYRKKACFSDKKEDNT